MEYGGRLEQLETQKSLEFGAGLNAMGSVYLFF
jgi:hypothetical protein